MRKENEQKTRNKKLNEYFRTKYRYLAFKRLQKQIKKQQCTTDQADLTDWMSFLPSNLMEEISPNTEALNANS